MTEGELKNRRIIIKDIESGRIIADTQIIRYNSLSNSVMISTASFQEKKFYNISAIIFTEKDCMNLPVRSEVLSPETKSRYFLAEAGKKRTVPKQDIRFP